MTERDWLMEARGWSALLIMYAVVIFAGWIVYTQVVQRPDCQLLPPSHTEKGK